MTHQPQAAGQLNLLAALVILALVVGGVWAWHHLSFDTQDYIVDELVPIFLVLLVAGMAGWMILRNFQQRRQIQAKRDRLMARFRQEPSAQKRRDIAFALVELNQYEPKGLEPIAEPMAELFIWTLKTALGDKQHRYRGMAASYLGVLQHHAAIPLLLKALEDDHAYVRSSAALALGRMRAREAKEKLERIMKDDWDQTVRSRAREAVERIGD